MAEDDKDLEKYDDIDLDKDPNFITSDDPDLDEFEYDEAIVMIGDVRQNDSSELMVVTKLNEDVSTQDELYYHTIKPTGETSKSTSELVLTNCKLIRRFETWQEAATSDEFNED